MKKILSYVAAFAVVALTLAGCANEPAGADGEGRLVFTMNFGEATRAFAEAPENIVVKIGNSKGYTHIFEAGDELPEEVWLASGNYFIEVTGGNTEPALDGGLCYAGRKDFTITNGNVTPVEVVCKVSSTLISVEFDESIPLWLAEYSATIFPDAANSAKTLVFDSGNVGATAYVMLAKEQTKVDWTFAGAHKNGTETVDKTGAFQNLLPGKHYTVSFKYTEIKGTLVLSFTLTVDDTTVDIGNDIIIVQNRPVVEGENFDLGVPQDSGEYTVRMTAASGIKSIVLSGSVFGEGYDVVANQAEAAAAYGITLAPVTLTRAAGDTGYNMTLSQTFYNAVEGKVTIKATDNKGNEQTAAFIKPTATIAIAAGAVWATHATVTGTAQGGVVKYAYRPTAGGDWKIADTGLLTGLMPETEYQVCMHVDGEIASLPATFTTEAATPLYNGGFEMWWQDKTNGDKGTWYANASAAEKFWDSGNNGTVNAMLIGKEANNITTRVSDPRPGSTGTTSAQLKSNWFGAFGAGAFAAGNIYTGDFGITRTSGPSGTVHFGQPFTARPTALKVWYKATAGTINYKSKEGAPVNNGDTDKYQIFIALVDGADYNPAAEGNDGGSHWHTVDTADLTTTGINYATDPRVIAFGEIVGSENVGWTPHTIEIKYRDTARTPTHIVLVASASMYGDYFTGSTSSVMWIDDFELVYDENIAMQ